MEYNSGSNWASNFKSAESVARERFEITSTITSELYDTKYNYQLIVSITKCKNVQYTRFSSFSPVIKTSSIYFIKRTELQAVEKQLLKEPNSAQMIDPRAAKLSDYSYPVTKSSNWTAVIGYPRDRAKITWQIRGARRTNHWRVVCYRYDYSLNCTSLSPITITNSC